MPNEPIRRVAVLDTSAFLAGYDPFSVAHEQVTVPKVEEEILRNSMVKMRFQTALESGKVKVRAPSQVAAAQVKVEAGKSGDYHKLSETDLELLSLALQLKTEGYNPQIVSDDYSIQNVAKKLGIEFSALATFGIKRQLEWVRYCPACFKQYPADSKFMDCQVCGTPLKRKPKKRA
ncbi:MAG: NOB1 family endonuclease [Candidatus Bathyarchaeia archaeon]